MTEINVANNFGYRQGDGIKEIVGKKSTIFINPELEGLFKAVGNDAREKWLEVEVDQLREWLIKEVDESVKPDVDVKHLKEIFIGRLTRVIAHYERMPVEKKDRVLIAKLKELLVGVQNWLS